MATKFTSLEEKKEGKKTKFDKVLLGSMIITKTAEATPYQWNNVKYIGYDVNYGDVFKCWDDDDQERFKIYFAIVVIMYVPRIAYIIINLYFHSVKIL